nr:hypothetical protein [uncultured Rhodoferax sp.]
MKRTITITFDDAPGAGWDVQENGKCCDGLVWGEMVEQVISLTIHPARVGNGYAMHTPQEWKAKHEAWRKPKQTVPPLLLEGPTA